ncbi:hypothetical protein B0H14DRAFT_3467850 [Mycena olivaceomarginata]|nr:hypothetical protein B0H14DRAFT_3467850 [Mycena olivaceomarginata]
MLRSKTNTPPSGQPSSLAAPCAATLYQPRTSPFRHRLGRRAPGLSHLPLGVTQADVDNDALAWAALPTNYGGWGNGGGWDNDGGWGNGGEWSNGGGWGDGGGWGSGSGWGPSDSGWGSAAGWGNNTGTWGSG